MSKIKIKPKSKKSLSSQWEIIEDDDILMAQDGGMLDLFYSKENENEKLLPQKQWLENWMNHPEYEKKLANNLKEINDKRPFPTKYIPYSFPFTFGDEYWKEKAEKTKQDALKRLLKVKDFYAEGYDKNINLAAKYAKSMFPNEPEEAKYEELSLLYGSQGEYRPFTHSLFVNSSDATPSTGVHEYTHSTGMDSFLKPLIPQAKKVTEEYKRLEKENPGFKMTYDMIGNPMMSNYQNKGFFEKTKYIPSDSLKLNIPLSDIKYLNKSNEVYPRIMELRYNGQVKPGQIIDKKSFENIKKQSKGNQIFDMYSDEEIIEMMNKLAQSSENQELNQAKYGKSIKFQDGGKYPLIKEGGYDIKRALELGYEPDEDGHMPSRDYETGQYLKAKNYQTTPLSILYDELAGYKTRQDLNGNLYSIPREQQYPDFDLNNPPVRTFQNGGNTGYQWSTQKQEPVKLSTPKYAVSKTETPIKKTDAEKYVEDMMSQPHIKNINKKYGNPKVKSDNFPFINNPFYFPLNNTIYLNTENKIQGINKIHGENHNQDFKECMTYTNYATELPHSKQANEMGKINFIKKYLTTDLPLQIQLKLFGKNSPYSKKGTIEYEAHEEIQPQIEKEVYSFKSGGKIKTDPKGYWNKDNIGKPVNIPSNRITMKGVNQPLMGISDTGDVQYMQPNGEYLFDGNSVLELPLAQDGKKIPFENWYQTINPDFADTSAYDLRTAYKKLPLQILENWRKNPDDNHLPDTYKLPSHPTFSDESIYFNKKTKPYAGKWVETDSSWNYIPYNPTIKDTVIDRKLPLMQTGGTIIKPNLSHADSVAHQVDKILKYEQLRGGVGGSPLPSYGNPEYKKMLMDRIYPEVNKILPNASAMEKGEAMDFIFNTGWDDPNKKITKDPRAYALQEYYRKYDPSKLKDGKWEGRKGEPYSFDEEYNNTIGKLAENERRVLMNRGRDWYYQNINNPSPGVPNPNYYNTWYGRIWNTNDFTEFDPNNPKFLPPKRKYGGKLLGTYKTGGKVKNSDWEIID